MGLETGTFIDSLVATNPVGATDPKSQGDDHLRLIKSTILATWPNLDAAVNFTPTEANRLVGLTGLTGSGNLVASASPTFTGTLSAAIISASGAITGVSFGGITSANLVDKSASETISGTWAMAVLTATSYEGILATNLMGEITAIDTTVVNSDAAQPGYKGAPQRSISDNDTMVLTDAGKQIYMTAGASKTLTIPANGSVAYPVGTIIPVINDSGNDWSIAITTDTLEKYGGSTGTQTLGGNQKAVLEKVTSTLWKYSSTD